MSENFIAKDNVKGVSKTRELHITCFTHYCFWSYVRSRDFKWSM